MNVASSGARSPREQPFTVGEQDFIRTYATRSLQRGTHFGQGGCTGADEIAGRAAWAAGLYVVTFLPADTWKDHLAEDPEAFSHEVRRTGKRPIDRDHDLAEWCDKLRAFPLHEQERSPRSGTWTTIRMAMRLGRHVSVMVLRPRDNGPPMLQVARAGQQLVPLGRIKL